MGDIFDEEVEEVQIARKEWNRTENDVKKTGYRLGLSAGHEETLQEGFDVGYAGTVHMGFTLGQLQGQISATLQRVEQGVSEQDGGGQNGALTRELDDLLTNGCAHLQHCILNLQHFSTTWTSSSSPLVHNQEVRGASLQRDAERSVNTACGTSPFLHHHQTPSQGPGRDGGAVGDVTALLGAMSMQELSSTGHSVFDRGIGEVMQRYQAVVQRLDGFL
ncbi:uncharacterized protein LOC143279572 [Babylonia areolata]|uniref:uncharacterized protein LOC143279572 n=1 Tax=Babylonia areolata TaxID=304850 RepID=UPI003FD4F4DB